MRALRPFTLLLLVCSSLLARAQDGQVAQDSVAVFGPVTALPEFPGGEQAIYPWLVANKHYPKEALAKKIQGTVYIGFVVEKDGWVDQVVVRRGCNPLLDEEAVRLVRQMPNWKPGLGVNGTAVPAHFTVPIQFKL